MAKRTRYRPGGQAAGYCRRSTDRQEQSIGDQRKAIEAYAAEHGFTVVEWYIDDALSGAGVGDRGAFQEMIRDARRPNRPFSHVLVYDVKRFGRLDNDETGYYRYLLGQAGVEVVYVSEGFNGDDTDDLLRPVKQWQARQELKDLSKVVIRGQVSKSEGGWWLGGMPPYGYDLAYYDSAGGMLHILRFMPDGGKEVYDETGELQRVLEKGDRLTVSKSDRARLVLSSAERVELVRTVFGWYVREGLGYKSIADRLNREGMPSPRGGKWSMTTIREMVSNPAYAGDLVWNRRSMAKFHRIKNGRAVAKPRHGGRAVEENDPADWIVTRDTHPAIISRQEWARARAKRTERCKHYPHSYRRGRGARSEYLLTGLIGCARCGHGWQGHTKHGGKRKNAKTQYYACGGYVSKGNSVCRRSFIRREQIEGMILEQIGAGLRGFLGEGGASILRRMLEELVGGERPAAGGELAGLLRKRSQIEAKIDGILDNISEENRDLANRRIGALKRELYDIQPRIDAIEAAEGAKVDIDALAAAVQDYMRDFERVVAEGTVDEKRSFIRAFTRRVELDPETGEGLAEIYDLPHFAAVGRHVPPTRDSSLILVAEARLGVEKRAPGRLVAFSFAADRVELKSVYSSILRVSRLAA